MLNMYISLINGDKYVISFSNEADCNRVLNLIYEKWDLDTKLKISNQGWTTIIRNSKDIIGVLIAKPIQDELKQAQIDYYKIMNEIEQRHLNAMKASDNWKEQSNE